MWAEDGCFLVSIVSITLITDVSQLCKQAGLVVIRGSRFKQFHTFSNLLVIATNSSHSVILLFLSKVAYFLRFSYDRTVVCFYSIQS